MKKYLLLTCLLLAGCNSIDNPKEIERALKVLTPSGAPALAFLSELNNPNYETNTVPSNIIAQMSTNNYDLVVVDVIGGLNAINKKNLNYNLEAVITFGNFYIYSTGNDEDGIMDNDDNIIGFSLGQTPDKLFKHLYPDIQIDEYVAGVSDIAPIAISGTFNKEKVDYCLIAEPLLYNVLNNPKSQGSVYANLQDIYQEKHGSKVLGAAIFSNNTTRSEMPKALDNYLSKIQNNIESYLNVPLNASNLLDSYGDYEKQASKIGINSKVAKGVLENNSINLGYLASSDKNFKASLDTYLGIING